MSKIEDGSPAFACAAENGQQPGMSLREYYAAHAPISLRDAVEAFGEDPDHLSSLQDDSIRVGVFEMLAALRLEYADAMILAENGESP